MGIQQYIRKLKTHYLETKVQHLERKLPNFQGGEVCRKKYQFFGRVQGVGFRIETKLIADQLQLTGKAMNQYDGSVAVEVQGQKDRIEYLIEYLHQVKRFRIERCIEENKNEFKMDKGDREEEKFHVKHRK